MSNILDAIRKAEADRLDDGVPSLEAIVQKKRSGKNSRGPKRVGGLIWIALALVIASAVFLYKEPLRHHGSALKHKIVSKSNVLLQKVGIDSLFNQSFPTQPVLARNSGPVTKPSGVAAGSDGLNERQTQLLNSLRFDVVSFSKDKVKRFVMVGNQTYREGDQLEGFFVKQINPEGVVLNVNGKNILVRP